MIRPTASLFFSLIAVSLLSPTMSWAEPETPVVLFEQPSHFTAPDGADVLVTPGTYRVEQSAETQIRLIADLGQPSIAIQATATTHEDTVVSPLALAIAEEGQEDEIHLVLLLPDGRGLDATGSLSGTRSRATNSQPINQFQMQQALSQYQPLAKQRAFSSVLRVPPAAAATTAAPPAESIETSGPGNWVTWNYLAMRHPEIVAQALADVQTGKQPRASVAGLASEVELTAMLKTNWIAEVSAMREVGVTPRGLPSGLAFSDQVTAIRPQQSVLSDQFKAIASPKSPLLSGQVTTIPQKSPLVPILKALPVILPPRNLGSVWAGQQAIAVVSFTAPVDGYVEGRLNLNATNRHFRIVHAKAYTGVLARGKSLDVSLTIPGGQYQDVVLDPANPPSQISKAGFVAILAQKGQRIDYTVAFEPVGLGMTPVGDNEATLELSGATSSEINILSPNAPVTTWTRLASIHARFEGINFGVLGAISDTAITVFYDGTPCGGLIPVPVSITFHNAEQQARSVSVTAESLSPALHVQPFTATLVPMENVIGGVTNASGSVQPFTLSLAPGETKQVPISLQIDSCGNLGTEQSGTIRYAYAGVVRRAEFSVTLYPNFHHWYNGNTSGSVGYCTYSWDIYIHPDGTTRFHYTMRNRHTLVGMQLDYRFSVLGQKIGGGVMFDGALSRSEKTNGYTVQLPFVRDNFVRLLSAPAQVGLSCHTY